MFVAPVLLVFFGRF